MRDDRLRLQDILDAMDVIAQYLPADRAAFDQNAPVQSHIYRHVMIVGEAAWRLSPQLKAKYPQVPWKQIEGMRHILVPITSRSIGTSFTRRQRTTSPRFGRK